MNCKTARLFLEFSRPQAGELDADDVQELNAHLRDCSECGPMARAERQADELLGAAMRAVPIPADLSARLKSSLAAARGSWYRRRVAAWSAAAALLLAALGGAFWLLNQRPVIDPQGLADKDFGVQPAEVEKYFLNEYGLRTAMPRDLNYGLLYKADVKKLYGQDVPCLQFINGASYAEVLVLSPRQFDVEAGLQRGPVGTGGRTVWLRKQPSNDNIVCLITYNSDSLDWLILKDPTGGGA